MRTDYFIVRDSKRSFKGTEKFIKLVEQDGKCDCCGDTLSLKESVGGHILSWAGGNETDAKDNLVVLCEPCNSDQSDMSYEEFKKK